MQPKNKVFYINARDKFKEFKNTSSELLKSIEKASALVMSKLQFR